VAGRQTSKLEAERQRCVVEQVDVCLSRSLKFKFKFLSEF
jgi:hypothetical protein